MRCGVSLCLLILSFLSYQDNLECLRVLASMGTHAHRCERGSPVSEGRKSGVNWAFLRSTLVRHGLPPARRIRCMVGSLLAHAQSLEEPTSALLAVPRNAAVGATARLKLEAEP